MWNINSLRVFGLAETRENPIGEAAVSIRMLLEMCSGTRTGLL